MAGKFKKSEVEYLQILYDDLNARMEKGITREVANDFIAFFKVRVPWLMEQIKRYEQLGMTLPTPRSKRPKAGRAWIEH